ncbi:MAG: hypothetical protein N4A35_06615 [Flavobacteriales bacterium]|jgi:hypothetical protein|nr:hypothetical protein [Flavobacteriales bacterium]
MLEFILSIIFIGIILYFFNRYQNKKQEELRNQNLKRYEKFREFIKDYDKTIEELKTAPVKKVNYTLSVIMPKYGLMLPLLKYKERINNWDDTIKGLKDLDVNLIKSNVKDIEKRFFLIDKYGEVSGDKLYNHDYFIGMTEEMLIDTKGFPTKKEKEELKTKTKLIYIYGNKSSGDVFTFVNGLCERYIDR